MEYIRTFTREFEAGDRLDLLVDSRSGTVSVRGEDTTTARVEVVARLWADSSADADEQADLIERGVTFEGKRLSIRAPTLLRQGPLLFFGRGSRIDYQATVPRATDANIASRSGLVEIEQIKGPLAVDSRSGRVGVREIAGDTRITSRSGTVRAEGIGGSLFVESRSGTVRISGCRRDVEALVRSGTVQIEDVAGDLKIDSRSGMVGLANVGGALTVRTASGSIRYEGPVRGPFDIEVMSGSVRLLLDSDSRFFLDAESSHGGVHSDMPLRRRSTVGAPVEGAPTVRVRTRSGSIHIAPR